ncbi:hypothetical protein PSEUDO9AG_40983 [Pseudomonas sp. 9Ag]|nr:hypothetical protein PSEUDO9AG_40983 [Pseudomonas sp. 9Ag]
MQLTVDGFGDVFQGEGHAASF